ncbi:MAG: hypothetical protein HUJ27_05870 [Rhodobacteraceae bacterium]|nr:hypothetical protein [Paracoccaceae bacterium]
MTVSVQYSAPTANLQDLIAAIAPKRGTFDLLGLVSGYRAYAIFTELNAKSDAELAALGLKRQDVARVAMNEAFDKAA